MERQAKWEDPEYQRNPVNNSIYDIDISSYDYYFYSYGSDDYYYDYYGSGSGDYYDYSGSGSRSHEQEEITPVNTFYPPGTVCYVDKSGGQYIM